MSVKVSFALPQSYIDAIKAMAESRKCTVTEVIRRAIATETFMVNEVKTGSVVLLKYATGATHQVVFQ